MRPGVRVLAAVAAVTLSVAGRGAEAKSDYASEINRELESLRLATETDINYSEYSSRVNMANAIIQTSMDKAVPTLSASFRNHASMAMCYYVEGARGWNARITREVSKVPPDSCVRRCEGPNISEALRREKQGDVFYYSTVGYLLLKDLWNCAKSETDAVPASISISHEISPPRAPRPKPQQCTPHEIRLGNCKMTIDASTELGPAPEVEAATQIQHSNDKECTPHQARLGECTPEVPGRVR